MLQCFIRIELVGLLFALATSFVGFFFKSVPRYGLLGHALVSQ